MPIIAKGAEANLILRDFSELFYPVDNRKVLVKHRIKKKYRAEKLDRRLRGFRTTLEAKLLSDAKEARVPTPTVFRVDRVQMKLVMEYIEGDPLKEFLEDLDSSSRRRVCETIGEQIARLHDFGIIHGDLTTSNMIRAEDDRIYFIDFGLGEYNSSTEAQGTDLHLLHRTLRSTHFRVAEESYRRVVEGYKSELGEVAQDVIDRVKEIESRGRYIEKDERVQT